MKTFAQRFEEKRGILDNGAYVRSKVHEVLSGTSFRFSEAMPSAPSDGVLLGIAFYSLPDLAILDELVGHSRDTSHSWQIQIEVFDILIFKSMQEVEAVFPGLTPYGTPMIGVWAKGQLVQKGWVCSKLNESHERCSAINASMNDIDQMTMSAPKSE